MQSLDNATINHDPFVFYGITDIASEPNGPYISEDITINVMIVVAENNEYNENSGMTQIMFRYQEALKETIKSNWSNCGNGNKIFIKSLLPVQIESLNDSQSFRVIGIEFNTVIS